MKNKLLKWTGITISGILLFMAGSRQAFRYRGYDAIGGEVFLLLLPVIYYVIEQTALELVEEIKRPNAERGQAGRK